ncbi:MAG: alkaline phosphatase [Treponema sp.]|jgi:predicted AlkP superfamily pyrophosphatase or phosphodiesterase|nr:alkaline phosphatase [Treponema sp.]
MFVKTKSVFALFHFAIVIIIFMTGCANTKPALQTGNVSPDFVPAKHLVFIGLDGWGGAYISKSNMPTVKRMMSHGAWSLDARCVMPSVSWPNWTSLFYGTPPEQRNREDFPSIFTIIKDNEPSKKSVLFYEWEELEKICPDEAAEKQEILSNIESAMKVAAYIKEQKPFFTAVAFDEPDFTGHTKSWGSAAYYSKLTEMDNLIAVIEQAVKDAGIYDSTVFVFSADHGGAFRGHGVNFLKHRKIPMIFYGYGIKDGFAIPSPVNIYDITPTMAALLGMEIPPEWTGRILHEIFK